MYPYCYLHCLSITIISTVRNLSPPSTIHCSIAIHMHSDFRIVKLNPCRKQLTNYSSYVLFLLLFVNSTFSFIPFHEVDSYSHYSLHSILGIFQFPKDFFKPACIKIHFLCREILWAFINAYQPLQYSIAWFHHSKPLLSHASPVQPSTPSSSPIPSNH